MRDVVHFDFARREWSLDRTLASIDDRVMAGVIPTVVLFVGLLVQWYGAHTAQLQADALRAQVETEQPQIASVMTLANEYQQKTQEYHVLTDKQLSGPAFARSLSAWMRRVRGAIVLTNITASDGGQALSVSGEGPSIETVRTGLIDALRNVSSASLTSGGKTILYTVTTGAASPSPGATATPMATPVMTSPSAGPGGTP